MSTLTDRLGDYLLEKACAAEVKQAGLMTISTPLSFGNVEYLRSKQRLEPSSEAIVMLHGAAADKTSWVRLAKHLGSKTLLLIPDLPGHGHSVADTNLCYSVKAQAERVKELLQTLGIKRVHVFGNSMGATIAIHLATTSPQLVALLVLISAAGFKEGPSWLRQHVARTGINPMIEIANASGYRAMMHIGMASPPYIPGIILSALARVFVQRQAINQKIINDIAHDIDQTGSLSTIVAPALIIWGAADQVEHVDNAEFLHQRLSNSCKIVMEGIGHVPMVEDPMTVAGACNAFLANLRRAEVCQA